jgi:hypothetical protein
MKNLLNYTLLIALFLGVSATSFAQSAAGEDHGNALNIFVGFGDNYTAITANYEFTITKDLTIAPVASIVFGDNSDFGVGGRLDYYFDSLLNLPTEWDIYAGVDTGLYFDSGDFDVNGHMGVEYLFNDKIGLIGEFGVGSLTSGSLGVGIHF